MKNKIEEGHSIDQGVFDKLSLSEIQVYFKANMLANRGGLNLTSLKFLKEGIKFPERCEYLYLGNLKSLPTGIKFPENCERINLSSLESLPEGVEFPENCEYLYLDSLEYLPERIKFPENCEHLYVSNLLPLPYEFFENNPNLKGKVCTINKRKQKELKMRVENRAYNEVYLKENEKIFINTIYGEICISVEKILDVGGTISITSDNRRFAIFPESINKINIKISEI